MSCVESTNCATWTDWQSRTVAAPAAAHSGGQPAPHGICAPSEPEARCVV
jgi:hypothetical protein